MRTKRNVLLGCTILAIILVLLIPKLKKEEPQPQLASMNFLKCTVAKFLLDNVDSTKQIAPLFSGLGDLSFAISSQNADAQKYFDQGLRLTYAFNHAEAHRSFMEASRQDNSAAMTYWGQAYALGPNINDPFPDIERKRKAHEAISKAQSLVSSIRPIEKALINALAKRYSADTSVETAQLNESYMKAMQQVARQFPEDDNVQTLYGASVMNTVPWNYWDNEGNASPNIPEAKEALEKAIKLNPKNPGAHHYYIHMVELPQPDLAEPSADALVTLMPAAGHLVHMPSHIYIRVGRYHDAVKVNQKAILADEDYISQCYAQGMYPLAYYPHNIHFLWSAASLLGNSEIAVDAAIKTAEKVPVGEMKDLHFLQNFASTPLLAYVRFGKWNNILTTPSPNPEIKHLRLIWHYARGIAFVKKNNLKEAIEELSAISSMLEDKSLKELMAVGFDNSHTIAQLAHEVVAGEIAAHQEDYNKAIEHLTAAVEIEDALVYNEPSAWYIPPRQNLGAVLLKAEKFKEAEAIFKEDLEELRQNGWSLIGLYQSLKSQGKTEEAQKIMDEFREAWQYSDHKIATSVL